MGSSVGVVVPTFNRAESTLKAIESVLAQTVYVEQIVVVDDGSSEEAAQLLAKSLAGTRVQLITCKHSGNPGKVRNFGIDRITSDYVAFLDSDDTWEPRKIELQLDALEKDGSKRAVCTNAQIVSRGIQLRKYLDISFQTLDIKRILTSNYIICSSVLVDRKILEQAGKFSDAKSVQGSEDYATWLRICLFTDWIYMDKPLVNYSTGLSDHFSSNSGSNQEILAYFDFMSWVIAHNARALKATWLIKRFIRILIRFRLK